MDLHLGSIYLLSLSKTCIYHFTFNILKTCIEKYFSYLPMILDQHTRPIISDHIRVQFLGNEEMSKYWRVSASEVVSSGPIPTLGSSQPPITPAPRKLIFASAGLCTHIHIIPPHTYFNQIILFPFSKFLRAMRSLPLYRICKLMN